MPINITKYIDITSGVGAGTVVRQRELILREFTENHLVPTNSIVEFESASEVLNYFGADSTEYDIAAFYFGWISKNITKANKIAFARWANVAVAPEVFGDPAITQALASWTSISSGAFYLTLGLGTDGEPEKILLDSMNFTGATSLANVASIIQAKIRAAAATALWTGATVTYDAVRGSFNLVGGATGEAIVAVDAADSGDIAGQLGWISALTILSDGSAAQTLTELLDDSTTSNNNFGSFAFIPSLSIDELEEISVWNNDQNVNYMFLAGAATYNLASDYYDALVTYEGTGITYRPTNDQFPHLVPALILAATNYEAQNSVQNYMYQLNFPGLTASVSDSLTAGQFDDIRCNYYGVTQTAGQNLSFYQDGVLMGGTNAPVDMNTYANEMWLKDAAAAQLLTLQLSLSRIPANKQGVSQILTALQEVVNRALFNGVISVGKALTIEQKFFISAQSGLDKAWHQVQSDGFWMNAVMVPVETTDSRVIYKCVYSLIYSKDDVVRKIEGQHELI